MNPADQTILIIFFFALTFFVFFLAWRHNSKSKSEVYKQYLALSEELALSMEMPRSALFGMIQGSPSLYGSSHGREVSIFSKSYGLDNMRQTDTCIRMMTKAPADMHFVVSDPPRP